MTFYRFSHPFYPQSQRGDYTQIFPVAELVLTFIQKFANMS